MSYADRIARAYATGTLDPRGAYAVSVAHDPGCPQRLGTGDCTCTPDITAASLLDDSVTEIGLDGEAITTTRTI